MEDLRNLSNKLQHRLSTLPPLPSNVSGLIGSNAANVNNNEHKDEEEKKGWNEEDWQVRELMRLQANEEIVTEMLLHFLSQNDDATYEQWIMELFHPNNNNNEDETKTAAPEEEEEEKEKESSPSSATAAPTTTDTTTTTTTTYVDRNFFYSEESSHRRLWNEFAGPNRQVSARPSNTAATTNDKKSEEIEEAEEEQEEEEQDKPIIMKDDPDEELMNLALCLTKEINLFSTTRVTKQDKEMKTSSSSTTTSDVK